MDKKFKIKKITPLPDSEVEILVDLSVAAIVAFRIKSLANLQDTVTLPGFRKGHIPEKLLTEKIGEMTVLEECVELALAEYYIDTIKASGKNVIGAPRVAITKLAPGNDVEIKITVAEVPAVTLPDYKSIAKEIVSKKEPVSVDDKEIEQSILEIRKQLSKQSLPASPAEELPELTDDYVSKLGDFKDVADFKSKLVENLQKEKEIRAAEKTRLEIMEKILGEITVVIPSVLIESELDRMMAQFADNIESMGIKKDDYMKQVGKNEEALRVEWKDEAAKRAKTQLVLNNIIATEKLEPLPENVKKEAEHLISHYKDAEPLRVEAYVETMLANDNAWKFLESQQ
jgi:FKBP-type peptidyl-prolyl cis-trans isomerase (trigger factor)